MPWLSMVPRKLVGALALVLAFSGLLHSCQHYQKRAAQLETQLDNAIEVSNANAEQAQKYAAEVERISAISVRAVEVKNDIRRKSDVRRGEILATLPENDGPLAPVLRDQLNRLPVATYPDSVHPSVSAAVTAGTAVTDAGTVPAGDERDAKRRGAGR